MLYRHDHRLHLLGNRKKQHGAFDRFFSQIRSKLFCSSLDNAEHIDKFILAAAEKQFSIADISDIVSSAFQIAGDMGRGIEPATIDEIVVFTSKKGDDYE